MDEQLRRVTAATLGLDEQDVEPSLTRETTDAWDSLNHLRLITAVEESFGIKLTMEQIESIDSVARLSELVADHMPRAPFGAASSVVSEGSVASNAPK